MTIRDLRVPLVSFFFFLIYRHNQGVITTPQYVTTLQIMVQYKEMKLPHLL